MNQLPPSTISHPGDQQERDPLLQFAKRWWWLLLIGAVLGAVAAVAYTRFGPVSYVSHALVQAPAATSTNNRTAQSTTQNLATEGSSIRMITLVSQAIAGSIDLSQDELQAMERSGDITVQVQRGTTFIEISVTDSDSNQAEGLANAWVTTFVDDINARYGNRFDSRHELLQQQVDFVRTQLAAAGLFERESGLKDQLRDQRTLLLSLEASYQEALVLRTAPRTQSNPGSPTATTGDAEAQTALEVIMIEQIADVQGNIDTITQQLEDVQAAIGALPEGTDPLISSSYAAAYASELTTLTNQIVEEQILAMSTPPALIRYGDASSSVRVDSLKKFLFLGVAAGGALFAALGLLIEWIQARRKRAAQEVSKTSASPDIETLLQELGRLGFSGDARERAVEASGGQMTHAR